MTQPVLLIDGDEYLYKACAALEVEVQWDAQNHVLSCNAEEAWDVFCGSLEKVIGELDATKAFLAFTGTGNFRRDIYPAYKAKRGRKPLCYGTLFERAHETFKCLHVDGLEADDILGIWATSGRFKNAIIVSADKDMQTLPATIWREGNVIKQSPEQADAFWLFQTLTGDTADGYPGCPGVGKVKAEKLIAEFHGEQGFYFKEAWDAVVKTYEAAGLTAEDAVLQAQLARILRNTDYVNKEVKLWQPDT